MDDPENSGPWSKITDENYDQYMAEINRKLEAVQLLRNKKPCQSKMEAGLTNKNSQNAAQISKNMLEAMHHSGSSSSESHSNAVARSNPSVPLKLDPNFVPKVPWAPTKKCPLTRTQLCLIAKSLPKPVITDDIDDEEDSKSDVENENAEFDGGSDNDDDCGDTAESNDVCAENVAKEVGAFSNDVPQTDREHKNLDLPAAASVKVLGIKGPMLLKENKSQGKNYLPQCTKKLPIERHVKNTLKPNIASGFRYGSFQNQPKPCQAVPSLRNVKVAKPQLVEPVMISNPSVKTNAAEQIVVKGKCYNVMQPLGSGGSSTVQLVCEEASRKLFAIKCVDLTKADAETCEGYLNEIKLLQKLQGNNRIVTLNDFEHDKLKKCLYVVMEHGDTDLASYVNGIRKQGESLSHEMVKFYWAEMLKAVQVIHHAGIVHSDLKPANFLLVKGHLKLIDFGIAGAMQPDVTSIIRSNVMGTFNYISPEALRNTQQGEPSLGTSQKSNIMRIGVKADVWSLGCILYSWVYGKTPFQHISNIMDKFTAILSDAHPISFQDLPDKLLLDVLKKCLTRDRNQRASTEELLQHPFLTSMSPVTATEGKPTKNLIAHLSDSLQLTPRRQQKLDEFVDSLRK